MKPNMKVEQEALPSKEQQTQDVQQIREISKEDLNEISGGCGDMGGVVVIRF
jgi:bacteriocin-like protein